MVSEKFIVKLLNDTFKQISDKGFIQRMFYYMINYNYRVTKRLDKFLLDQIRSEPYSLLKVAKQFQRFQPGIAIIKILKYVHKKVRYKSDIANFGNLELWSQAEDILVRGEDDCDGINSLIYVLARFAGVPSYLLWNCIGDTSGDGKLDHYWLVYISPKTGKLYSIDGTYHPDFTEIEYRTPFNKDRYKQVFWLWNEDFIMKPRT